MSVITAENARAWRGLAQSVEIDRPSVGKRVRVTRGKRAGREGIVERHQLSRYGNACRYGDSASHMMRDMMGRSGWCVLVRDDAGATFWASADAVEVLREASGDSSNAP